MVSEGVNVEDEGTPKVTLARLAFVIRARVVARLARELPLHPFFDFDLLVHGGIIAYARELCKGYLGFIRRSKSRQVLDL